MDRALQIVRLRIQFTYLKIFRLWSLSEADEVEWITLEEKMKESVCQSQ